MLSLEVAIMLFLVINISTIDEVRCLLACNQGRVYNIAWVSPFFTVHSPTPQNPLFWPAQLLDITNTLHRVP